MKIRAFFVIGLVLLFSSVPAAFGQDLTIILVRHAERDASPAMNRFDPDLAPEGRQRALKLYETLKKYNPEQIFSTNYRRTRFTVDPLATNQNEKFRIFVQAYDPAKLDVFAEQLVKSPAKTIVVAGHSNTTPKLANLLLKQEKYKDLDESVYNKIFIIRIKGNKVTDEVIEY
jgi:2,3-bisphosphoglycerate-dependent phosphoglycerate mutase